MFVFATEIASGLLLVVLEAANVCDVERLATGCGGCLLGALHRWQVYALGKDGASHGKISIVE